MNLARYAIAAGALVLGSSAATACGSDSEGDAASEVSTGSEATGSEATGSEATGVVVSNVWSRTSPAMATAGVVYFDLDSAAGDELVGASVDSSIAAEAQIHETVMDDDAMEEGDMDDDAMEEGDMEEGIGGTMSMVEVHSVVISAGETLSFAPGGFHVMLIDLVEPLTDGQEFDVTLTFADSGEQTITTTVQTSAS